MSDFLQQSLEHHKSLTLQQRGDCSLLGITPDLSLYVEEIYGEEDHLARYKVELDGSIRVLADEDTLEGDAAFGYPADLLRRAPIQHTTALNFSSGRYRGMRENERVTDLVQPLTMQEKMALVKLSGLEVMPPLLIGVAESVILAEAPLVSPDHYLVCRRLRLAYVLPQPRVDRFRQKYDYDTVVLYVAQLYNVCVEEELPLHEIIASSKTLLPGVVLRRPMDCLVQGDYVVIAEGGDETQVSTVHMWIKRDV